jgi:hypothetical protein
MIFKLLTNANYFIYYLAILFVFMVVAYLIYKIFMIENDLFYLNQKINKIEIEFNNPNGINDTVNEKQENFNMNEIIMNEIFNSESHPDQINGGYCDINDNGICRVNVNVNDNDNDNDNSNVKVNVNDTFNDNDNIKVNVNNSKINKAKIVSQQEQEIIIENAIDIDNILNDVCNDNPEKKEVVFDLKKEVINDDKESIISTNGLTKKKLQKLNLDKLKEKCIELLVSPEGSKAQLIDKIIESSAL